MSTFSSSIFLYMYSIFWVINESEETLLTKEKFYPEREMCKTISIVGFEEIISKHLKFEKVTGDDNVC